jgi:hypothetical protein
MLEESHVAHCYLQIVRAQVYTKAIKESKYRPRITIAHPRDCHFAHVQ